MADSGYQEVLYVTIKNCPGKEENDINLIKNRLKSAIKAGTGGSKHERSFRSVTYMKQKYPEFFREQATLALFFLTDEDDRSWEVSETDFINFLFDKHRIKGVSGLNRKSRKNTKIFIAVNDIDSQYKLFPGPECITNGEPEEIRHFMYLFEGASASNPKKYKSPINEVDLCDPNFSKRIQDFGDQLASILQVTDIPIRPTNLNNLDKDNLPSALRDSSGKPNMSCK